MKCYVLIHLCSVQRIIIFRFKILVTHFFWPGFLSNSIFNSPNYSVLYLIHQFSSFQIPIVSPVISILLFCSQMIHHCVTKHYFPGIWKTLRARLYSGTSDDSTASKAHQRDDASLSSTTDLQTEWRYPDRSLQADGLARSSSQHERIFGSCTIPSPTWFHTFSERCINSGIYQFKCRSARRDICGRALSLEHKGFPTSLLIEIIVTVVLSTMQWWLFKSRLHRI